MNADWLWLPIGSIRTSTLISAVVLFLAIVIARRDPLRGVVAVVAWTALFEIVYQAVGIVGFHWAVGNWIWETGALAGWLILASVLGISPDWRVMILFIVLMAVWIATGYHYNVAGQISPINVRDELLNEASKSALALAYLIGALRRSATEFASPSAGLGKR